MKPDKKQTWLIGVIILLLAALLRLGDFLINLTYDEIWTVLHFVPLNSAHLLFDLELPNNHPLNTIAVKWIAALGFEGVFIRLPNLLAGLGVIAAAGMIVRKQYGSTAALICMFFLALSAPLAVYSTQARGYMLQMFFLLLYIYALQSLASDQELPLKKARCIAAVLIIGALGAVLTLVSSAIFLAAFTVLIWGINNWKKPARLMWVPLLIAALLSTLYLTVNYSGLMTARQWGENLTGIADYCRWATQTLYGVLPLFLLPMLVWELIRSRQKLPARGACLAVILLSSLFTNGGPVRIYLPLSAMLTIWAALGSADLLQRIRKDDLRKLAAAGFIALALLNYHWIHPDWKFPDYTFFAAASVNRQLPENCLTIYPAADTFAILYNSGGESARRFQSEIARNNTAERPLLLVNQPGEILGVNEKFEQRSQKLPTAAEQIRCGDLPCEVFQLKRIYNTLPDNTPAVALLLRQNKTSFEEMRKKIFDLGAENQILQLNVWFASSENGSAFYLAPGAVAPTADLPEGVIFYSINPRL